MQRSPYLSHTFGGFETKKWKIWSERCLRWRRRCFSTCFRACVTLQLIGLLLCIIRCVPGCCTQTGVRIRSCHIVTTSHKFPIWQIFFINKSALFSKKLYPNCSGSDYLNLNSFLNPLKRLRAEGANLQP